jgi:hypothetical protein
VKVVLAYILFVFFVAIWAANRQRPSRAWVLILVALSTSVLFLSPRVL